MIFNVNYAEQMSVQIMPQPERSGKKNASLALHVQRFSSPELISVLQNYAVVGAIHNSHSRPKSFELKFNALLVTEAFV
jgi:hypothetical protein